MKRFLFSLFAASLGFGAAQLVLSIKDYNPSTEALKVAENLACAEPRDRREIRIPDENPSKEDELPPSITSLIREKDNRILNLEHEVAKLSKASEILSPEDNNPEYRETLAAEILDLTQTKDQIEGAFASMGSTMFKGETPEVQKYYSEVMQKYFGWDVLERSFLDLYTEVYSAQELSDIANFYRSDVGIAMIRKQPELTQKTIGIIQKINQDRLPKIREEIEAFISKQHSKTKNGAVSF